MKHEVKIPVGCKATVSVEGERILIIVDPKEDVIVEGPKYFQLSQENHCKLAGVEGGVIRGPFDLDKLTDAEKKTLYETDPQLDSLKVRNFIEVPHIQASAGQFVKSDAGYIAMTGEQNYTVVLTPSGEIQLNQSCNFPITIPAKFDDADKLMAELAKQKALMIVGKELVKWRPAKLTCEPFSAINSVWKAKTYLSMEDVLMDDLLLADNIFPPGFLTEEKISQFKKTIMDLFDSWRQ